jgi:putative flippase GtrA
MTIFTDQRERTRFLKFIAVGAIGFLIDFGLVNLLSHFLNMWLVLAGTISFTCAVVSNFIWNRYWTYPDSRSRPIGHQLVMFFVVNVAGLAIRVPILWLLEPPLRNFFATLSWKVPFTPAVLARNLTLMVAVTIVLLWNFFVNRYWTYNDVDREKSPAQR